MVKPWFGESGRSSEPPLAGPQPRANGRF